VKKFSIATIIKTSIFSACVLLASPTGSFAADTEGLPQAPVPGKVTMVDIGAKACIPCKMMIPIMEELEKEYKDRAAIVFIDVWKNPHAGPKYGIKLIPTQIFYDAKGKEVLRHEGVLQKEAIIAELTKLGVK
jgi:thioredoxin 1